MKFVARFTSSLRFLIIFALVPLWREPLVRAAPGINYRITSVSVAGASALGEDRAKRVLELRVGSRTTDDGVEHALAALTREYHRHGFIKVSLSIEKSVTPATAGHEYPRLSLKLNVTEGKAYYIARLTFDGNAITNGDVVQKATALDLYKPYNPDDTYRWIKDLNRLGRFYPLSEKDVEVEIDDQAHKVFLTFHLKERGRDSTTPPVGQISFATQGRHDHRDYVPDKQDRRAYRGGRTYCAVWRRTCNSSASIGGLNVREGPLLHWWRYRIYEVIFATRNRSARRKKDGPDVPAA
jgi:hypothetical protein